MKTTLSKEALLEYKEMALAKRNFWQSQLEWVEDSIYNEAIKNDVWINKHILCKLPPKFHFTIPTKKEFLRESYKCGMQRWNLEELIVDLTLIIERIDKALVDGSEVVFDNDDYKLVRN